MGIDKDNPVEVVEDADITNDGICKSPEVKALRDEMRVRSLNLYRAGISRTAIENKVGRKLIIPSFMNRADLFEIPVIYDCLKVMLAFGEDCRFCPQIESALTTAFGRDIDFRKVIRVVVLNFLNSLEPSNFLEIAPQIEILLRYFDISGNEVGFRGRKNFAKQVVDRKDRINIDPIFTYLKAAIDEAKQGRPEWKEKLIRNAQSGLENFAVMVDQGDYRNVFQMSIDFSQPLKGMDYAIRRFLKFLGLGRFF